MIKTGRRKRFIVFSRILFRIEQIFNIVKSNADAGGIGLGRKQKAEGRKQKAEKDLRKEV